MASGAIHNGEGFGGPEGLRTVGAAGLCVVVPGEALAFALAVGQGGLDGFGESYGAAVPGAGEGGGSPGVAGFADAGGCCLGHSCSVGSVDLSAINEAG